ncbi:hypothetical protein M514_03929 [Trichuris suis]|uniref:Uncharacterized protein n=1 Tax=Trichuris suis TaxID=68888 RepID=A0A085MDJ2_9BILA|nr:hypothetical protein M513_03929 [Trichuris suis]KFD65915.1 hypothetical protein M514_03929 [Trichuris suis]
MTVSGICQSRLFESFPLGPYHSSDHPKVKWAQSQLSENQSSKDEGQSSGGFLLEKKSGSPSTIRKGENAGEPRGADHHSGRKALLFAW